MRCCPTLLFTQYLSFLNLSTSQKPRLCLFFLPSKHSTAFRCCCCCRCCSSKQRAWYDWMSTAKSCDGYEFISLYSNPGFVSFKILILTECPLLNPDEGIKHFHVLWCHQLISCLVLAFRHLPAIFCESHDCLRHNLAAVEGRMRPPWQNISWLE